MPTKAELEEDLDGALSELANVRESFERFKRQVADKAVEVAAEQGWCDQGLRETLKELGLQLPLRSYRGEMTIKVHFTGKTTSSDLEKTWISESLLLNANDIKFDNDWESSEFSIETTSVDWFEET